MRHFKENEQQSTTYSSEFTFIHTFCVILSLFAVLFDLCTDLFLVLEYWQLGFKVWSLCTLILIIFPSVTVQIFSLRWHLAENSGGYYIWTLHFCCLGLIHRYFRILQLTLEVRRNGVQHYKEKIIGEQSDASILHVFECFLEAAPQLVLQLFIIITLQEVRFFTGLSALASIFSISWGLVGYSLAQRRARRQKENTLVFPGLFLQFLWRFGMLTARLSALVLFLYCFQSWFFLFIVVHWFIMLIWIIRQKTDLCETKWEEILYNCIAAVIYCFCFFNLKDGRSRWRLLTFYLITMLENMTILTVFLMAYAHESSRLGIVSFVCIVGGTVIGTLSMAIYYRFFHPSGPLALCVTLQVSNNLSTSSSNMRTLKRFKLFAQSPNKSASTDSKLTLSDSIVVVEEPDMEEIRTLQTWLKEAASEQKQDAYDDPKLEPFASTDQPEEAKLASMRMTTPTATDASSVLSAHDYENLAAVNIARNGGLRHWRGYAADIETYLHDDSVVRGSTVASTTSTSTYTSQDYLDAIAACDEYIECSKINATVEGRFAPTPLHTIIEEVESICSDSTTVQSPPPPSIHLSTCTLVATIDQINRATPPVRRETATTIRRKFSLIRKRFESPSPSPPPPSPPPLFAVSPFKRVSVKDMRTFFLRQLLNATPKKIIGASTLPNTQIVV